MSFARLIYLYCDGPDCPRSGDPFSADTMRGETVADHRRDAHAEGWRTLPGGEDLCPECLPNPVGDSPAD